MSVAVAPDALKDILELEAQVSGVRLPAVDPVKPETDTLQRALGISPWVQDGRVLFGPGQTALTRALLAVPQDAHAWDLVDAFGLAVTGLPPVPPARSRLLPAGDDPGKLARSYAVKPRGEPEKAPLHHRGPTPMWRSPSGAIWRSGPHAGPIKAPNRKRAASYAGVPR